MWLRLNQDARRRFGLSKRRTIQRARPASERPIVYMHIPKTGGIALINELRDNLAPTRVLAGLDKCLFGSFDEFNSLGEAERVNVFTEPAKIPRDADLVAGHFAFSTLLTTYPSGQFVTMFREPITRLLSFWAYCRAFTDLELAGWGAWGNMISRAQQPLATFLCDSRMASTTDNVTTRMLLWPHLLIPTDSFIDPMHDGLLLRAARKRLRLFSLVDIVESPDRAALRSWLGMTIGQQRENETRPSPPNLRMALQSELTLPALDRLDACSRLDLQLWRWVGLTRMNEAILNRLRTHVLLVTIARHAALFAGS